MDKRTSYWRYDWNRWQRIPQMRAYTDEVSQPIEHQFLYSQSDSLPGPVKLFISNQAFRLFLRL